MTLNGVITIFAFCFTEFDRCRPITLQWLNTWPIMSAKYRLPFPVFHFWPKLTHPSPLSLCDSWATCRFSTFPIYCSISKSERPKGDCGRNSSSNEIDERGGRNVWVNFTSWAYRTRPGTCYQVIVRRGAAQPPRRLFTVWVPKQESTPVKHTVLPTIVGLPNQHWKTSLKIRFIS